MAGETMTQQELAGFRLGFETGLGTIAEHFENDAPDMTWTSANVAAMLRQALSNGIATLGEFGPA